MIAVLHPLPDVAVHVMQAKGIRSKGAGRCRLDVVPLTAATVAIGHHLIIAANVLTPGKNGFASSSARVLRFGLGKQAVSFASQSGKPNCILLGFAPGEVNHRPSTASPAAVRYLIASTMSDARIPLVEGYLELGHREGF